MFVTPVVDEKWRARRVCCSSAAGRADGGSDCCGSSRPRPGLRRGRNADRARGVRRPRRAATRRAGAGGCRRADARGVQRRQLQDGRIRRPASPAWIDCRRGRARDSAIALTQSRRPRAHPRRVQQPGARARQRAGQHADAARVRAARARRIAGEAGVARRDPRRDADRAARDGAAARRGARQQRAAAADGVPARPAGRAGDAGARAGRQGHHVRHRRHLDQAGRRHGADEGRHGRRRRRRRARCARSRCSSAPIRVIGVVPTTENMPGGTRDQAGRRPARAPSGKTVEVINTDAEGRLILGDGLWYARQLGATHLVDVATLTGAVVVALGKITSGLFGTPDEWVEHVRARRGRAGDRVWPMPLFDEYREQLKSEIADMTQHRRPRRRRDHRGAVPEGVHRRAAVGAPRHRRHRVGRRGAAVSCRRAPTGVAVRTLAELAFEHASWPWSDVCELAALSAAARHRRSSSRSSSRRRAISTRPGRRADRRRSD